jgi:hypothetical protein
MPCAKIISDIGRDVLLNNINLSTNNNLKYSCKFCNKGFSSRQGKFQHQKFHCKVKKEINELELAKIENAKLKLELAKIKNNKLKLENAKLKQPQKSIINCNSTTIINDENKNDILINNFGHEKLDYVKKFIINILKNTNTLSVTSFINIIKFIYFNDEHPENYTFALTNLRANYVYVMDDNIWIADSKKNVLDKIKFSISELIETILDEQIKIGNLTKNQCNNIEYDITTFINECKKKKFIKSIELMMWNETKRLKIK